MAVSRIERMGRSFADVWADKIYPEIQGDYAAILRMTPTKIANKATKRFLEEADKAAEKRDKAEKKAKKKENKLIRRTSEKDEDDELHQQEDASLSDACEERMKEVVTEVGEKKEKRNVYMNLAWTGPVANTPVQADISYAKVASVAVDLFCSTAAASQAASADAQQPPAGASGAEDASGQQAQRGVVDIVLQAERLPWRIPDSVERGFEIPICLTAAEAVPELGHFQRLGMDVVVNAVWLAFYWAKLESDAKTVSAIQELILDWPMDFMLVEGSSPEQIDERKFLWGVNQCARVERLRDFIGLESSNLMRIVSQAAEFTKSKLTGVKKANARIVQQWLNQHVNWGALRCPNAEIVERLLLNWTSVQSNSKVLEVIEAAVQRWGRNNLLDWPTKIGTIVTKTDASSLGYVVESLYTQMWRKNAADPYGASELKKVVVEILWVRAYTQGCISRYPLLIQGKGEASDAMKTMLHQPLKLFLKTEGPDRDPTWVQSLPHEAQRLFMKHVLELTQGLFRPEIQGALEKTTSEKFSVERFHQTTRVTQRFATKFRVVYDSLAAGTQEKPESSEGGKAETASPEAVKTPLVGGEVEKRPERREMQVSAFRMECEQHCKQELEARVVSLAVQGIHVEIKQEVTNTRLYQNLTEEVPFMGFYDVKNARLCSIFEGEGLTHREPVLDVADVERFLATVVPLMRPGRDLVWILAGRTESNLAKLKKVLYHAGGKESSIDCRLLYEIFYLCYNAKQMQQYGHWKRQRGIANSKTLEQCFCVYKGKMPRMMPKARMYVDQGSSLFNQVVRNVPVLAPRHQALVNRDVREASLASMTGIPHHEDKTEKERESRLQETNAAEGASELLHQPVAEDNGVAESKTLVASVLKKRKLYKQLTGTEVPWFPHDNDMTLLKELCWETGRPRWVVHGTPAGGAGVQGCMEAGCSVVLLCFDEHHRDHLARFLLERAVESMVSGTSVVFNDQKLRARSIELNLMRADAAEKDDDKDKKDSKEEAEKKDKKDEKGSKEGAGHKAKKVKKNKSAKGKEEMTDTPRKRKAKSTAGSAKKSAKKQQDPRPSSATSSSSDESGDTSSSERVKG